MSIPVVILATTRPAFARVMAPAVKRAKHHPELLWSLHLDRRLLHPSASTTITIRKKKITILFLNKKIFNYGITNSATSCFNELCTPIINGVGVLSISTKAAGKRGM
jgi:hypothetical protein